MMLKEEIGFVPDLRKLIVPATFSGTPIGNGGQTCHITGATSSFQ